MSGNVIAMPTTSPVSIALGDHDQCLSNDELQLLGVGVEVLLRVRHEVPVLRPRRVVDLGERVEVFAQLPAAHRAHADPVLALDLLGELEDHRQHLVAVRDLEVPHQQVHRLGHARACSMQLLVVAADATAGRIIGRRSKPSIRTPLSSFMVKSRRADHPLAARAARSQPCGGRRAAPPAASGSSSNSRNPNQPQCVLLVVVEGVVDRGR